MVPPVLMGMLLASAVSSERGDDRSVDSRPDRLRFGCSPGSESCPTRVVIELGERPSVPVWVGLRCLAHLTPGDRLRPMLIGSNAPTRSSSSRLQAFKELFFLALKFVDCQNPGVT